MKTVLCYGDSFTNNDDVSWVDYVSAQDTHFINNATSGSCFGNYSLYPVQENCLDALFKTFDNNCSTIILSYGLNDVSSILLEYTTLARVRIDINKCVDQILQLNSKCHIYFLYASDDLRILNAIAESQYEYLLTYLPGIGLKAVQRADWIEQYVKLYLNILEYIKQYVYITAIPMYNNSTDYLNNRLEDNMHPNIEGAKIIAKNVGEIINEK